MEGSQLKFDGLPDSIILKILDYLDPYQLGRVSQVSYNLNRLSQDQILWRTQFHRYFKLRELKYQEPIVCQGPTSWKHEFVRLKDKVPRILTQVMKHQDQVLHVSWSHNGNRFVTTSKDVFINVWKASSHPIILEFSYSMKDFSWKYTQFSQFNETDSMILVSGVLFGHNSTSGEIAVFSINDADGLQLKCRILNKPYDIFGTWFSERYFLSGELQWLGHYVSETKIWLNIASQETESEHSAVMNQIFKFYNPKASSVRSLLIANIGYSNSISDATSQNENSRDSSSSSSKSEESAHSDSIPTDSFSEATQQNSFSPSTPEELSIDPREKLLIFTCGSQTFTPHLVSFKRIPQIKFNSQLELGPSLKERIELRKLRRQLEATAAAAGVPFPQEQPIDYEDYKSVADKFDPVDATIDLHGHIIGLALSPDQQYLYLNVRAWPVNYVISDPFCPPPIAQEIDIHVICLKTLTKVGMLTPAHRGFTSNDECFFIFLDVSDLYVASGAEDRSGYLWERNYGFPLYKYPHTDVVNCIGFCPTNSEILVTVSDDNTIKVWRSKDNCRELGIDWKELQLPTSTSLTRTRSA